VTLRSPKAGVNCIGGIEGYGLARKLSEGILAQLHRGTTGIGGSCYITRSPPARRCDHHGRQCWCGM